MEGAWFDDSHLPSSRSQNKSHYFGIKYCLQALLSHALLPESHSVIIHNGGLQLLTKLYLQYKENEELMCLMSRIICIFSAHDTFHSVLHQGGKFVFM